MVESSSPLSPPAPSPDKNGGSSNNNSIENPRDPVSIDLNSDELVALASLPSQSNPNPTNRRKRARTSDIAPDYTSNSSASEYKDDDQEYEPGVEEEDDEDFEFEDEDELEETQDEDYSPRGVVFGSSQANIRVEVGEDGLPIPPDMSKVARLGLPKPNGRRRKDSSRPIPKQRKRLMEIGAIAATTSKTYQYSDGGPLGPLRLTEEGQRARSCENCRARKTRCSSHQICQSCHERGERCIWRRGAPLYAIHANGQPAPTLPLPTPPAVPSSIDKSTKPPPPRSVPSLDTSRPPSGPESFLTSQTQIPPRTLSVPPVLPPTSATYIRFPSQAYSALMSEMSRLTRLAGILTNRWCAREKIMAEKENRAVRKCVQLKDIPVPTPATSRDPAVAKTPTKGSKDSQGGKGNVTRKGNEAEPFQEGKEAKGDRGDKDQGGDRSSIQGGGGDIAVDIERSGGGTEDISVGIDSTVTKEPVQGGEDVAPRGRDRSTSEIRAETSEAQTGSTRTRENSAWEDAAILLTLSQPQSYSHSPQDLVVQPLPDVETPSIIAEGVVELRLPTPPPVAYTSVPTPASTSASNADLRSSDQPRFEFDPRTYIPRRIKPAQKPRASPKNSSRARRTFHGTDHTILKPDQFPPGYRSVLPATKYGKDEDGKELPARVEFGPTRRPSTKRHATSASHRLPPHVSFRYDPYPRQQSYVPPFPPLQPRPPPHEMLYVPPSTIFRPEPPMPVRPPPPPPMTINPAHFLPKPKPSTSIPTTTKRLPSNSSSSSTTTTTTTTKNGKVPAPKRRADGCVPPSLPVFYPIIPAPSLNEQEQKKLAKDRSVDKYKRNSREHRDKRRMWHEERFMNVIKGKHRSERPYSSSSSSSSACASSDANANNKRKVEPVGSHGDEMWRPIGSNVVGMNKKQVKGGGPPKAPKSLAAQAAETWATLNAVNARQEKEKARQEKEKARQEKARQKSSRDKNRLPPIVVPVEPYRSIASSSASSRPMNFRSGQDPMLGAGPLTAGADHEDRIGISPRLAMPPIGGLNRRPSHWESVSPVSSHTSLALPSTSALTREDSLPSLSSVFDPLPSISFSLEPRIRTPPLLDSTSSSPTLRHLIDSPSRLGSIPEDVSNEEAAIDERFQPRVERDTLIGGGGGRDVTLGRGGNESFDWEPFEPRIEPKVDAGQKEARYLDGGREAGQEGGGGGDHEWNDVSDSRSERANKIPRTEQDRAETVQQHEESQARRSAQEIDAALVALEEVRDR